MVSLGPWCTTAVRVSTLNPEHVRNASRTKSTHSNSPLQWTFRTVKRPSGFIPELFLNRLFYFIFCLCNDRVFFLCRIITRSTDDIYEEKFFHFNPWVCPAGQWGLSQTCHLFLAHVSRFFLSSHFCFVFLFVLHKHDRFTQVSDPFIFVCFAL